MCAMCPLMVVHPTNGRQQTLKWMGPSECKGDCEWIGLPMTGSCVHKNIAKKVGQYPEMIESFWGHIGYTL